MEQANSLPVIYPEERQVPIPCAGNGEYGVPQGSGTSKGRRARDRAQEAGDFRTSHIYSIFVRMGMDFAIYMMVRGCRTDFGGNSQWQNQYLRKWVANTKGKGII